MSRGIVLYLNIRAIHVGSFSVYEVYPLMLMMLILLVVLDDIQTGY